MIHADPREDQEARLICDETDVVPARFPRPADVAISRTEVTRSRGPAEASDRALAGADNKILEVLADGARVAEIVVLLDQRLDETLLGRAPHLAQLDRPELCEARDER